MEVNLANCKEMDCNFILTGFYWAEELPSALSVEHVSVLLDGCSCRIIGQHLHRYLSRSFFSLGIVAVRKTHNKAQHLAILLVAFFITQTGGSEAS